MGGLGWSEILIILVIALIIFGPRKLPELGKSLGQSLAQFRRASEDFKRTWEDEVEMEKRRIEAPPAVEAEREAAVAVSQAEDLNTAPAEESSTLSTADEAPATVQRSEITTETKRDWM